MSSYIPRGPNVAIILGVVYWEEAPMLLLHAGVLPLLGTCIPAVFASALRSVVSDHPG